MHPMAVGAAVLGAQPATDSGRTYEIEDRCSIRDGNRCAARHGHSDSFSDRRSVSSAPRACRPCDRYGGRLPNAQHPDWHRLPVSGAHRLFPPGFPTLASAPVVLVERKEPVATVTLYLRRAAVIRGTVLDEGGASLGGSVRAFRLVLVDGRRALESAAAAANVDIEGSFRIADLRPGRYYVAHSPYRWFDSARSDRVYRAAFYPYSPDFASAQIITLASGDDSQIDFRPVSEPAYEISVKMPLDAEAVSLAIYPAQVGGIPNPTTVGSAPWDKQGRTYRMRGLPSGQYTIAGQWMAGGVLTFGSKRITIDRRNIGEVILEAGAEGTVPVAIRYDSPDHRPPGFIQLISALGTFDVSSDSAGTQAFRNLKPGRYALMAVGNAYVKSAQQGGRDALRDGVLVPEEGPPEPLEVSLGERSATFETTADLGDTAGGKTITVAFLRQTTVGLHFEQQISIYPEKDPTRFIRMSGFQAVRTQAITW